MFKFKNTKRALIASVLALVVCVSMLVGSTFAWFTDSVSSGRNTIQSGNLDVELYYTYDPAVAADVDSNAWAKVTDSTDIFGYNLWEPGYTKVAYFKVANEGSLALKYKLSADVYAETAGVNKAGESFLLSDYIYTAVVANDATRDEILATKGQNLKNVFAIKANPLAAGAEEVVAIAIWMPTSVGNEANHNGTAPSIQFGINLIATQEMSEADSFGKDYDVSATYPNFKIPGVVDSEVYNVTGNAVLDTNETIEHEIKLYSNDINDDGVNSSQGSVVVPVEAVATGVKAIEATVTKIPVVDSTVPVAPAEQAVTIEVTVTGIKENNTAPVKVTTNIGAGLGTVKLYHKNVLMPASSYNYNNVTGVLIFESTSFSPFTVVYDKIIPDFDPANVPVAIVTDADENENVTLGWTGWGGYNPSAGVAQKLDSVYLFTSPDTSETVEKSYYKNWYCDYYVKYVPAAGSDMTELPERTITLGGNYGGYGWVGFDNPTVEVNRFIPLLGSVLGNCDEEGTMVDTGWTYEAVVDLVTKFWCGVGKANESTLDINGDQFVVELRLTNPENFDDYIVTNRVTYTFGGSSVIENYTAQ